MAGLYCAVHLWPWKTEDVVFANLDGDNLITWEYIAEVLRLFEGATDTRGMVVIAGRQCNPGCTGRMAYTATDFLALGGYDCHQLHGMGYQDVDLRDRLRTYRNHPELARIPCEAVPRGTTLTKAPLKFVQGFEKVGGCLPNDTTDMKDDRSTSKARNCWQPATNPLTWGQMNQHNHKVCVQRLHNGEVVRNTALRHSVAMWVLLPDSWVVPEVLRDPLMDFHWHPGMPKHAPRSWAATGEAVPPAQPAVRQVRFDLDTVRLSVPTTAATTGTARAVGERRAEVAGRQAEYVQEGASASSSAAAPVVAKRGYWGSPEVRGAPAAEAVPAAGAVLVERPFQTASITVKIYVLGLATAHQVKATANTWASLFTPRFVKSGARMCDTCLH
jgi:hypothetical protein